MGSDFADVDNDGRFDLLGTDMSPASHYRAMTTMGQVFADAWFLESAVPRQYPRNALYMGTGVGRFLETARLAGFDSTDWTWSVRFADLDNDGRVDVHITNGMIRDVINSDLTAAIEKLGLTDSETRWNFWAKQPPLREPNLAFRNLGDLRFQEVGREWGLDHVGVSFGAALGDLDNDGDLDLVVNNLDEMVSVYRNQGTGGNAVRLRLVGTESNSWGIGATVRIRTGKERQVGYLTLSRGFMSQSDPTVHFGLGEADTIDELSIDWPSGHRQAFTNLPAGRLYTITEPGGTPPPAAVAPRPRPLFAPSNALGSLAHRETPPGKKPFDDFAREPLLPARLSRQGPGLALGDANGDGRDDLFLGSATGDWGTLLFSQGNGQWAQDAEQSFPAWAEDVQAEDLGLVFLDVDADGDQDLFVTSGGVECEPGDAVLRDRLYLNQGRGKFTAAPPGQLPDLADSGGVAAAADYDQDGDLDLFIGGRSIPGRYPQTPHSRLLNNDGRGTFRDVTSEHAPQLLASGLVTSGLWTDVDGDGDVDLLVTHEWGPIKLYRNEGGQLQDATAQAGLAERHGWWHGLAGRDLDADGDLDYVVTNLGRNTAYRVSAERPARLFYGDFAGDGRPVLVEGKYDETGRLVSAQNKPAMQQAIPFIEAAFPTFHAFASATLAELVGQEELDKSFQVYANTVDSVILRNDGQGRFTFEALPLLAQVSAGFGVVLGDFNADGHSDAYLVQNDYSPRRDLGRIDGGISILLAGDGRGQLAEVPPRESGLVVPGDAKSVVATDLNQDGWPDLVVGVNDDGVLAFTHQGLPGRRLARVRLLGRPGNPTALGARITLRRSDGLAQTAEVAAGGGYLSQQPADQWFGLGRDANIDAIDVRWPDGQTTTHTTRPDELRVEIRQPEIP
jgi:hypothetical protein